jgi:hypothetical protein
LLFAGWIRIRSEAVWASLGGVEARGRKPRRSERRWGAKERVLAAIVLAAILLAAILLILYQINKIFLHVYRH